MIFLAPFLFEKGSNILWKCDIRATEDLKDLRIRIKNVSQGHIFVMKSYIGVCKYLFEGVREGPMSYVVYKRGNNGTKL